MRDKILEMIKRKGPLVPIDIAQELRIDSVIASAYLSDLVSSKLVGISHLKLGSSPLYYDRAKKEELENYIPKLHPHEQEAAVLLKEKKVLRENTLAPQQRVALRNVKDFAVPLEVSFSQGKEIFWKWYAISNEEASEVIRSIVSAPKEVERMPEQSLPPPKSEAKPEPAPEKKEDPPQKKDSKEKEEVKEEPKALPPKKQEESKTKEVKEEQKQIETTKEPLEDAFGKEVEAFFTKSQVQIESYEIIKAKSEINFTVLIPTALGRMKFFVKAKKKKRLNEADITSTYAEGTIKRLPIILLTPADLPKKVSDLLEKDFSAITRVKLE